MDAIAKKLLLGIAIAVITGLTSIHTHAAPGSAGAMSGTISSIIPSIVSSAASSAMANTQLTQQCFKNAPKAEVETEVERLLSELNLEEKISLVHGSGHFFVAAVERLGIHQLDMSDGPHGVRHEMERFSFDSAEWKDDVATYLPPTTMLAATWSRDMAALHGQVLGAEARQRGKDIILGPGVNLARVPLNGRNFEYLGEDPFLATQLAIETIKTIQENDVAATIKHYALNTQEWNRTGVNAIPDDRTLREVYLPMYEGAVKEAKVHAVMGAYNEFRGTNANQSKELIDILKKEWGFEGVLLTDWNVDINTYDAAIAGLDIEMGTNADYDDYFFAKPLLKMVKDGKVAEAVVDEKVRRVLRLQLSIGMMDMCRLSGERNTLAHQKAAYTIASEGVVLLKNDSKLLPLDASKLKNILVLGVNADKKHAWGGGSSQIKALYEITPLEGLKKKLGDNVNIDYMQIKGGDIVPIAGENVLTRHWTGTPAWTLTRYKSGKKKEELYQLNVPDSAYEVRSGEQEFIHMQAEIKPITGGKYNFETRFIGDFSLSIDGKTILDAQSKEAKTISKRVTLEADKTYKFEFSYAGEDSFTFGWDAPNENYASKKDYAKAAKNADAVIFFGGLSHNEDRESIDRVSMKMPYGQDALISELLALNEKTVVFLMGGSPVEMPWLDQANALVWGWYGGMEGGTVYADVLFGDINPSGKLPFTMPKKLSDTAPFALDDYHADVSRFPEGVFIGHRWLEKNNIEPLFAFGHGQSYTTFKYDQLAVSLDKKSHDKLISVKARITNTGKVAGAEIVQLYLRDEKASVERPIKELKGFDKVYLQPGESKTIEIFLGKRDLAFWDIKSKDWKTEPGIFEVLLGASLSDIRLRSQFDY